MVKYRKDWVRRMLDYATKMKQFHGEAMEQVTEPDLCDGDQELVLVTHDESTFHSNDGTARAWLADEETMLRKKSMGAAIMVSDFLCPCHGRLKLDSDHLMYDQLQHKEARIMIFPGANRDGYWRSEHMVEQTKDRAIPIFEALHPGCKGECEINQK